MGRTLVEMLDCGEVTNFSEKGYKWFVEQLKEIPEDEKVNGYAQMVHDFMVNIRASNYLGMNDTELRKVSDVLHNLPFLLANDMKGSTPFDDKGFYEERFWEKAFNAHNSLLGDFISGLWSQRMRKNIRQSN